jgi:hypothetical protein
MSGRPGWPGTAGRPPRLPSVQPIGTASAVAMARANRGSGVLDPTRTATSPATVQRLRDQLSDGTAGYRFFTTLVGKNAASYVPGATAPLGFKANPYRAAAGVVDGAPVPSRRGCRCGGG